MNLPEFTDFRQAIFFAITLAVAVAGIFGFADFVPSDDMASLINAIVAVITALVGLLKATQRHRS